MSSSFKKSRKRDRLSLPAFVIYGAPRAKPWSSAKADKKTVQANLDGITLTTLGKSEYPNFMALSARLLCRSECLYAHQPDLSIFIIGIQ